MDNFLVNSFLPPLARGSRKRPAGKKSESRKSRFKRILHAAAEDNLCKMLLSHGRGAAERGADTITTLYPPSSTTRCCHQSPSHQRQHSDNWRFGAILPSIWTVSIISRDALEEWRVLYIVYWCSCSLAGAGYWVLLYNYNVCNVIMCAVTRSVAATVDTVKWWLINWQLWCNYQTIVSHHTSPALCTHYWQLQTTIDYM